MPHIVSGMCAPKDTRRAILATRIRLKRMGRKFYAFYRVVIADSRKKRDGKVIEQIGIYDPNKQPSLIQIDSERAQYWLGVGAQPSEPVVKLLKIKGLPGAEGTLKTAEDGPDAEARIKAADDKAQKLKAAKSEAKAKAEEEAKAAAEAAAKEAESSESEAEAETADSSAESAEESSSEEKAE